MSREPASAEPESADPDTNDVAAALRESIGLLLRRMRQQQPGELTLPENAALTRLNRGGPTTSSALAKLEQISPQSMGAILAGLEARGLVARHPDPQDGRRIVLSLTDQGLRILQDKRNARNQQLAEALASKFTADEVRLLAQATPLLERLAQTI
jgi:DNA-binding MarR family transcriptional regulator